MGLGIAVILILAGLGAYLLYQRPLGPALETLDISASVSTVATQVAPASVATVLPEASSAPEATATAEPPAEPAPSADKTAVAISTNSPRKVCGENEAWNILVLGSDASESFGTPGSDLTRVLRVDFPNKKVAIFAFSRDLLVDASALGFQDPDITITKLGMVFYEARMRSTESRSQGCHAGWGQCDGKSPGSQFWTAIRPLSCPRPGQASGYG
jgi:hypothetical protein